VGDDYNAQLAPAGEAESRKGGEAAIENPAGVANLRWQTRPAPLTPAEDALADALQAMFADGVHDLAGIVQRLNRMKISAPGGAAAWTEENFRSEVRRLADLTGGS